LPGQFATRRNARHAPGRAAKTQPASLHPFRKRVQRFRPASSGKALHLVLIGADGGNKKFVQPDIDEGVEKARAAAKPAEGMK
jgi:hypothetical protein